MRRVALIMAVVLAAGCGDDDKKKQTDNDAGPDAGPDELIPAIGEIGTQAIDCSGSYAYPEELTNDEGLGHHGWGFDDLTLTLAWSMPNRFVSQWISSSPPSEPSLRVNPELAPEAGYCYRDGLVETGEGMTDGEPVLADVLSAMTAFSHPDSVYAELERDVYDAPDYDLTGDGVLVDAIEGLLEIPNDLPGAPAGELEESDLEDLAAVEAGLWGRGVGGPGAADPQPGRGLPAQATAPRGGRRGRVREHPRGIRDRLLRLEQQLQRQPHRHGGLRHHRLR